MSITIRPITSDNDAPWANWAEVNARTVLVAAGLATPYSYLCDELAAEHVPAALGDVYRLIVDVPGKSLRAPMARNAESSARFDVAGSDDATALRRLRELFDVLAWADAHKVGVWWG